MMKLLMIEDSKGGYESDADTGCDTTAPREWWGFCMLTQPAGYISADIHDILSPAERYGALD